MNIYELGSGLSNRESQRAFDLWCHKVSAIHGVSTRLSEAWVKMVVTSVRLCLLTRH